MCSCPPGMEGNAFVQCHTLQKPVQRNPCHPSPCGPNSQCREINGQGVCSCVPGFIGSPPTCRPECVQNNECSLNQACFNQKCRDPCIGTCGIGAICTVVNHSPICICPERLDGDPFFRCQPKGNIINVKTLVYINLHNLSVERPADPTNPCSLSPCGPNSECRPLGDSHSCSCLTNYIGSPPNCRPECVSNIECPNNLACINQKCKDPCPGQCGSNAECRVISHSPMCVCLVGFVGDAFLSCSEVRDPIPVQSTPCIPSPCGANAVCREQNNAGSCQCLSEYFGNPYDGCRPECVVSSDCPSNRACVRNKCQDPCPGVCGTNAVCHTLNHSPTCYCNIGFEGNPFQGCSAHVRDRK